MFELLNAYESVNKEKNVFLKYLYKGYIRHNLRKSFFIKFKYTILNYKAYLLNKKLVDEFIQFYKCVAKQFGSEFCIDAAYSHNIYITYYKYSIMIYFYENEKDCDVHIRNEYTGKVVAIHPLVESLFSTILGEILIMAIYNYCVLYIYGKENNLFIHDKSYIQWIEDGYFR